MNPLREPKTRNTSQIYVKPAHKVPQIFLCSTKSLKALQSRRHLNWTVSAVQREEGEGLAALLVCDVFFSFTARQLSLFEGTKSNIFSVLIMERYRKVSQMQSNQKQHLNHNPYMPVDLMNILIILFISHQPEHFFR